MRNSILVVRKSVFHRPTQVYNVEMVIPRTDIDYVRKDNNTYIIGVLGGELMVDVCNEIVFDGGRQSKLFGESEMDFDGNRVCVELETILGKVRFVNLRWHDYSDKKIFRRNLKIFLDAINSDGWCWNNSSKKFPERNGIKVSYEKDWDEDEE